MKSVLLSTLFALFFMAPLTAQDLGKHLFILSGQSNMARLNPKLTFTPTVEAAFGKENVVVVKDAMGGRPIRLWYKDWRPSEGDEPKATGELYDRLMEKVNAAAKGQEFETVTLIWMQGERDAGEEQGEVYAESLNGLIQQLSEDLGRDDLYFVIGRLSDFDMTNEKYPHWTLVREAQVKVAEASPRGTWVDTDDLNDGIDQKGNVLKNDLHYSPEGYKILGTRFAEESIALITGSN